MPIIFESQESSSPMITRAVASGLAGRDFKGYQFSQIEKLALEILGYLPQTLSQWLIPRVQRGSALDPRGVEDLKIGQLIRARLNDYQGIGQLLPAAVLGVGMGGATAHLSLALRAAFLPQAFVMTLKGGSVDGDVRRYFERSKDLARHITEVNPGVMSIQHYDPVHDGWLVRRVNHLRLKLTRMPDEYKQFILNRVKPGGDVVYLEGGAKWLRYQVGDQNVFQVGGWGDISAGEFLEGSERIRRYCRNEGLVKTDWRLEGYPLEEGPESEWGSEPGLAEEIEAFCYQNGYHFVKIHFDDPSDFSLLAYHSIGEQFRQNGINSKGTIIETFSQYDPAAVMRYGLKPLWLIFNTRDSVRFLSKASAVFDSDKPVFLSALSTFSQTPDMAEWQDWQDSLKPYEVISVGARASHTPADTLALIRWQDWLRKQAGSDVIKPMNPLHADDLARIAAGLS